MEQPTHGNSSIDTVELLPIVADTSCASLQVPVSIDVPLKVAIGPLGAVVRTGSIVAKVIADTVAVDDVAVSNAPESAESIAAVPSNEWDDVELLSGEQPRKSGTLTL